MPLSTRQGTWRIGAAARPPLVTSRSSALIFRVLNSALTRITEFWDVFVPLSRYGLPQSSMIPRRTAMVIAWVLSLAASLSMMCFR